MPQRRYAILVILRTSSDPSSTWALIKCQYHIAQRRFSHAGALTTNVVFLRISDGQLPTLFCLCGSATIAGLDSLRTNLACRRMSFETTSHMVTIACCWPF